MIISILVFLVILTVLVLIHEYGHFWVAKKLGIKVEEFGFGFPPKLFGIKKGETEYTVNALPIGGFVKLYGEDEAGAGRIKITNSKSQITRSDEKRAFYARPAWQRAAVCVAGVVMNLFLAVVIYYGYLSISGFKAELPLYGEQKFYFVNEYIRSDLVVSAVSKDSPAEKAGLRQLVKIISINNIPVQDTKTLIQLINDNKGKEITLTWVDLQNNKTKTATMKPRVSPPKGQGALGIAFFQAKTVVVSYDTPVQKAFSGFIHPMNLTLYNFNVLGKFIGASFQQRSTAPLGSAVSGPVAIYGHVQTILGFDQMREEILNLLNLMGLLSLSLAIFNILPIPALDGGRLFFILIEAVSGKKINQRFETYTHTIGMVLLLTLIALITFKDITGLFR